MMALAAIAALPFASLTLYRGAPIEYGTGQTGYLSVLDTYLEAATPEVVHGGETVLIGGPGRTILIRFEDLARVIPASKRIESAHIEFTTVGADAPVLKSASRVKVAWGEGPFQTIAAMMAPTTAADGSPIKPTTPPGAATWQQRLTGPGAIGWRELGAGGNDVEAINEAKGELKADGVFVLSGLGKAVQALVDHPLDNYGFALSFSTNTEFASSQSPASRPRLVLELVDAPAATGADLSVASIVPSGPSDFTATIKNVGTAPSAGFSFTWISAGRVGATIEGGKALAPGETITVTAKRDGASLPGDGRFPTLGLRVMPTGGDNNPRNNQLEISQSAKVVDVRLNSATVASLAKHLNARGSHAVEDWVQTVAQAFNEVYLSRSRFSFAPEGAKERISVGKIEVDATSDAPISERALLRQFLAALDLGSSTPQVAKENNKVVGRGSDDPFCGLSGWGDTRFEGMVPGLTVIGNEPVNSPLFAVNPLEPTGLLSASEVALINAKRAGTALTSLAGPRALIVRAVDLAGRPLPSTELSFFTATAGKVADNPPALTLVTGSTGTALVPSEAGRPTGLGPIPVGLLADGYLVRGSRAGINEWCWLKSWQLFDAANRGAVNALILDLRFNLPGAPIDGPANLARERIATDSAKSLPAKLSALTDESSTTTIELPGTKDSWVEIDLARDRTVGDIILDFPEAKMWPKFEIVTYATGQTAAAAMPWVQEVNLPWTLAHRSDSATTVHYRGGPRRFRFIRIINRSDVGGQLGEIRLLGSTVAESTGG